MLSVNSGSFFYLHLNYENVIIKNKSKYLLTLPTNDGIIRCKVNKGGMGMKLHFRTPEKIIELYKEGARNYSREREMELYENGWFWDVRAYRAGHDRGLNEFELVEKEWHRFGKPNYDERYEEYICSLNHRDKYFEKGISVIDEDYEKTFGYHMFLAKGTKKYALKGIQIGWGSDGEPVIIPTSKATEVK